MHIFSFAPEEQQTAVARVLFVDDDQDILDGLRNMLRKERMRWEMVFASGAGAALEELNQAPFDVVVSDMRMPGMDGATLLAKVREEWPGTTRIVLSGSAEREALMRVLPIAHQFLGKPCDGGSLRGIIARAAGVRAILDNAELRAFIGGLQKLPSPPTIFAEMSRVLADPSAGAAQVAQIVERDPAMAAKLLQLVNSSYFGGSVPTVSIATAVSYLGFELIKSLALTVQIFGSLGDRVVEGFSVDALQRHSFVTARMARRLCPDVNQREAAFSAGLLHDIGQIVLALGKPTEFQAVVRTAARDRLPLHIVEKAQLGFTHAEVGAYLLGQWGLPLPIVEAVALHHRPMTVAQPSFDPLAAVHIASALAQTVGADEVEEGQWLSMELIARLGVADLLPGWRKAIAHELAALDD